MQVYPWEIAEELPGIHLQAKLDMDYNIGKAQFGNALFRIYSPLDSSWISKDDLYNPITAITCSLDVPSANIEIDLFAKMESGADSIFVEGRFEGVSLKNLANLSDLSGSSNLMSQLPAQIVSGVKKLEKLELMDVAFSIGGRNKEISFDSMIFMIGIPGLNWKIWDDDIEVKDIGCCFFIDSPFSSPSLSVDLWGNIEVEKVPLQVEIPKYSGDYMMSARLEEEQTLPLKRLMQTYVPAVPAPADLTIDSFLVTIAPGRYYQMSGGLAGKPKSWNLNLGPESLTVSNVVFDFLLPSGGSLGGRFRGDMDFGKDVTLSMEYTIPGNFVIRSVADKITLQHLIGKLCTQQVALPKGHDITFLNSTILIQKQRSGLVFQLAT